MDDAFGIKSKNSALVLDPEGFVFFFFFLKLLWFYMLQLSPWSIQVNFYVKYEV